MKTTSKRSYRVPRLVKVGSFEELTRAASSFENMVVFGMTGGEAVSATIS